MHKPVALVLAATLTAVGFMSQPVASAQAAVHRVQTVKADVDGDGRADSVRIDRVRKSSKYRTTFRVTVRTAKGRSVRLTLTVRGSADLGRIAKPLVATTDIDGVTGSEIVLRSVWQSGGDDSLSRYAILTWRKGHLVKELPATGAWVAENFLGLGSGSSTVRIFDQVEGIKYALTCHESDAERYDQAGHVYREFSYRTDVSAWQDGAWQPATVGAATSIPDPRCEPHSAASLVLLPG